MTSVLQIPDPDWRTEDLRIFADAVDRFVLRECVPHLEAWRRDHHVPRDIWRKAGQAGLLLASIPVEYGGGGGTLAHEAVIIDRLGYHGASHLIVGVQNLGVAPYIIHFGTEAQKQRWLPRMAAGEIIGAMGLTEPGAGSDLKAIRTTARRDGEHYVINGQKMFTTLGSVADILVLACKVDRPDSSDVSLFMIETEGLEGFSRSKPLDVIGHQAHGACALFFDDVRVPADCLLGGIEGQGLKQMMVSLVPERLIGTLEATAMMEYALRETIAYVRQRKAFGKTILEFQNTQFVLADCKTEATLARTVVNHCIGQQLRGTLDPVTTAMTKLWVSETLNKVVDRCLQLFGGYGYINEYPIAHMYTDARLYRIGGGTSEIMKLIIGRSL